MKRRGALRILIALGLGAAVTGGSGCRSTPAAPPGTLHTECVVCKANADPAGADVEVRYDTPRALYGGRTYYFNSPECLRTFLRDPARYAEE